MSFKASLFQESNWWINPFLFSAVFCETEDHTHQTIQLLNLSSQALGSAISFLFSSQSSSNQCLHCSHLNQKTAPGYNSKYWFFPGKWASNLHIWTHSPQIYIIIHDPKQFMKCVELPPSCLCSGFPQLCSSLVSHQLANLTVYSRDSVFVLDPTLPVTSIIISPRAFQLVNLSLRNRKPQNHITTKILIQKQRSKPSFVGFGGVKLSHLQKHLRSQSPGSRKHSKQMCVRDLQQQMLHDSCCSGNHSAQLRKIAHSRKAKKQGWGVLLCFE